VGGIQLRTPLKGGAAVAPVPCLPCELAPKWRLDSQQLIGLQGSPCRYLYLIVSGRVVVRRRAVGHEDRVIDLLGPGDLFGEDALQPGRGWRVSTETLTPVVVQTITARQVPTLIKHYPKLAEALCQMLAGRLEKAYIRSDLVFCSSALARVSVLFQTLAVECGEIYEGRIWLSLPLTITQIGQIIQLRRETVSRVLAQLRSKGLLESRSRRGLWLSRAILDFVA